MLLLRLPVEWLFRSECKVKAVVMRILEEKMKKSMTLVSGLCAFLMAGCGGSSSNNTDSSSVTNTAFTGVSWVQDVNNVPDVAGIITCRALVPDAGACKSK